MITALARLSTRPSKIPFDMFDLEQSAEEARAQAKLRSIYHRGQELAWDGRAVLTELMAAHGPVRMEEDKRRALSAVFEVILWGELAAWRISAELAAEITPLEAKMAATSQAHDEARHFYVMYDYLCALGYRPRRIDLAAQKMLDLTLNSDNLAHKLLGMQLMIEPTALAIFSQVRELDVEPVLSRLLVYFEKDEARHVGLGVQYLPELIRTMTTRDRLRMVGFQVQLLVWELASLKRIEPSLRALGVRPIDLLRRTKEKQLMAFRDTWIQEGNGQQPLPARAVIRLLGIVEEALFADDPKATLRDRLGLVMRALRV